MTDEEEDKAGSILIWVLVCLVFYILVHVRVDGNICVLGSFQVFEKRFYIFNTPPVHYRIDPPWGTSLDRILQP